MNFITREFLLFFIPVLFLGWMLRGKVRYYRLFLIAASLLFYSFAGVAYLPLLIGVGVLNWGTVRLMAFWQGKRTVRRLVVTLDIIVHILILGFFKYYEFLVVNLMDLFSSLHIRADAWFSTEIADLLFPVGLSFFTFQGLSYAIDHYRKPELPFRSFLEVLSYVSFFPSIMAGPILREGNFFPQVTEPLRGSRNLQEGFGLILSGLFKKVVVATYLSEHVVNQVFETPGACSSWTVLAGVYGYAIQIFCDFSGYSDLAIGVGRLLGFRLPDNFANPYLAVSLQDFWRRWHISLSEWLRDYLYIPLGGSRRGSRSVNLIVTMLIGGLWHGSHLRFLVWGGLHGLGLAVNHFFSGWRKKLVAGRRIPSFWKHVSKLCSWLLTFHFIVVLWIFFRAEDMDRSLEIIRRMLDVGAPGEGFPVLVIPAILTGFFIQVVGKYVFSGFVAMQERLPWPVQAFVLALLGGLILNMGPDGVLPFIYFKF